jgi:cell shape-determining protein MreD
MKYIIYFIAIIILTGINIGLFGNLKLFGISPNILLLFVVGSCLQREAEDSFIVAFISGLFLDFLNGLFIGSFTFSFLLLTLLLYVIIHRLVVFELSWKYLLAITAAATIFINLAAFGINQAAFHYGWSQVSINLHVLTNRLPLEMLYNLALIYPLYALAIVLHNSILRLQGKRHRII